MSCKNRTFQNPSMRLVALAGCPSVIVRVQIVQARPWNSSNLSTSQSGVTQLVAALGTALLADRGLGRTQLAGGSCSAQSIQSAEHRCMWVLAGSVASSPAFPALRTAASGSRCPQCSVHRRGLAGVASPPASLQHPSFRDHRRCPWERDPGISAASLPLPGY